LPFCLIIIAVVWCLLKKLAMEDEKAPI